MAAPLVVAVNGTAAGAGLQHRDLGRSRDDGRVGKLTMAYTAAGLSPDGSSTWFLPRLIGMRRAQELMLTNRRLSAAEALEWGLVNQVVPDAELAATARALASSSRRARRARSAR
jgi:2-(1,2-epoxy-1,2-dihydrophenyl)acetyl-CoA isomerase